MGKLKNLLLLANPDATECARAAGALARSLGKIGFEVRRGREEFEPRSTGMVILLGGDGYLMESIRVLGYPPTPIFGVNFGNVGFLMNSRQCLEELPAILEKGDLPVEEYPVLEARVRTGAGKELAQHAFNDIVLERLTGQSIRFLASVDGLPFNNYSGDGIIIATSGGSTAYNLAAGGPVVHPGIAAMVITPLYPHRAAPFHSLQFSLLLPLGSTLRLDGQDVGKRPIRMLADGRTTDGIESVEVRDSGKRIRLVRTADHRFIATLARKFIGDVER